MYEPVAPCEVCAAGMCRTGKCSANYLWREYDARYGRCGCFEALWFGYLAGHLGRRAYVRVRAHEAQRLTSVREGLVQRADKDAAGFYVELAAMTRPEETQRYYLATILGVRLLAR